MKNALIVILAVAAAALGVVVFRLQKENDRLRSEVEGGKQLASQLAAAEVRTKELTQELDSARVAQDTAPKKVDHAAPPAELQRRPPGGRVNPDSPEFQALMAHQQRLALDPRYAALFKKLNLQPDQLEKFKSLLVERQSVVMDVVSAARQNGVSPGGDPSAFRTLITEAQAEVDRTIQDLLGVDGYRQFENYQKTMPQRSLVNQLEQSLSYTSTPLTPAQSEKLIEVLAASAPAQPAVTGNTSIRFVEGGPVVAALGVPGLGGASVTPEAIAQAQTFLSAPQVQALQQLQQMQNEQRKLQQAITPRERTAR